MSVTGDCKAVILMLVISPNLLCRKYMSESASGKYRAILRATKDNKGEEKTVYWGSLYNVWSLCQGAHIFCPYKGRLNLVGSLEGILVIDSGRFRKRKTRAKNYKVYRTPVSGINISNRWIYRGNYFPFLNLRCKSNCYWIVMSRNSAGASKIIV